MSSSVTITDPTKLPPVITITPATLVFPLTPPLTPLQETKPLATIAKPISPPPIPYDSPHSLHTPLKHHLAFLHPQTPRPILSFVATRLLSIDRPHGHDGEWKPLWDGCGDLSTAGVGYEAGKGCERRGGKGKELDDQLEWMYGVARDSFRLLELKGPGVGKI